MGVERGGGFQHLKAGAVEHATQQLPHRLVVVDDQHATGVC